MSKLEQLVRDRRPELLLFAGGILAPPAVPLDRSAAAEHARDGLRLLQRFFHTLGRLEVHAAVIPGVGDVPLRDFLHVGMNAEIEHPGVHVAHATLVQEADVALSGVGGELTPFEDSGEYVVRHSRATAKFLLRALRDAKQSLKILLLAVPPTGRLGNADGNGIVTELIDSYHPYLCVVGGLRARRGFERVSRTLVVNPGELSAGSAAWVDCTRESERQVDLLDL